MPVAVGSGQRMAGSESRPTSTPSSTAELRALELDYERALHQARIERYGSNPLMRFALTHFQHKMVRQGDLEHAFTAPAPFHPEFTARLDHAIRTPNTYTANACARKFAKSTYGSEIAALYAAAEQLRENIVLIGAPSEEKEYRTRLRNIVNEIDRNAGLLAAYPHLAPGKDSKNQWIANTDREIVLSSGCRIAAMPMGGNIRGQAYNGKRPDLVILDDPETPKSARSKEKCKEWREWIEADLLAAMANGGSVLWNGTYLSYQCLLLWARDEKGWPGMEVPIETPDGEPNWPALFPYEECRRLELLHGPRAWAVEFLLKPQAVGDQLFTREMFERNTYERRLLTRQGERWEYAGRPLIVFQRVDPAGGQYTDRNDFFALATIGLDPLTETLYLLSLVRLRVPYAKQVEICQEEYDHWQPRVQRIEDVQCQVWLKQGVLANRAMRVEGVKTTRNKHERIESWSILVRNDKIKFDLTQKAQAELAYDEAETYPLGAHDDGLDAASGACEDALELGRGAGRPPELHGTGLSEEGRAGMDGW